MLNKEIQQILMQRLQQLLPPELQALDSIGPEAAQVLLYNVIPEIDFVLMEKLPALKGHQYQPERVLHGEGGQAPQGPPAPQAPVPAPPPAPPQEPPMAPQGALGGLR